MDDRKKVEAKPDTEDHAAFRWNLSGWLGAQLGGTCWMLILAVLIALKDPFVGGVVFVCFAVPNTIGWSLWKRRQRLRPYSAMQMLVVVEGVFALIAMAATHLGHAMRHLPESSQTSPWAMYAALLVYPAVMFQFHVQERGMRRGAQRSRGTN